ncbi:MAG: long-chain-acyl-CoA synthetase [Deltaproteobacteria bacterium]|nr:long-chain-acyl-CoA synthetase [Deltaproteobacteria bacterium]MBW2447329.1 long-chain-acyl-CoA synthetase [Deltaproteobacteria bacterium]
MFEGVRFFARALPHLPRFASYRPDGDANVGALLEDRAEEFADRPFLLFEDQRLTYAEHNAAANRVAYWARDQGLRRGDVVALLMENRPEYLAIWMGLAKLGVKAALINTNLTGKTLRHALATSEARHLVLGAECSDRFRTTADDLERTLEVWVHTEPGREPEKGESWGFDLADALVGRPLQNPPPAWREGLVSGDDLVYIYTSGTTGPPKAARFSHLRFVSGGDLGAWAQDLSAIDVHYCALPLYHTAGGIMQIGATMFAGAAFALRRRFSASAFWDDVRKYDATAFQYIGEFCRYLVNQPERPDDGEHGIRVVIGNGLRPDIWPVFRDRFAIPRILEFYGATEGNVGFMNFENKEGSVGRYPSAILRRAMSNAKIVRFDVENEAHVRSEDGFCIECDADEPGELIGRIPEGDKSSGRFEGYTSKEDTDEKILRDVFEAGDIWYRTGDLLRQDAEGFHYFVDRIGDTFRWKGENVSTQEVAEVLADFPGLDMINVYGVEVAGAEGRAGMMAFVPAEGGAPFDGAVFHEFVSERLASYAAPLFVRIIESPELTGTFKLRKVTLKEEGFDPSRLTDPLYVRDDEADAYVPLTPERFAAIAEGTFRL